MVKTYPIGTKIRFLYKRIDTNKTGVIVGLRRGGGPIVFLPTADKHLKDNNYPTLPDGTKFTWKCGWDEIELFVLPNQQLLFNFME